MKETKRVRATIFDTPLELELGGGVNAPTEFRIWKAGANPTDAHVAMFTERSAELLLAEQATRGNLISVDVDHLSMSPTAPPESRKAVGWHRLAVKRDVNGAAELWAIEAQWTDVARNGLEKRPPEWRYVSPVYDVETESGEIVSYVNTALTNNPATWGMTPLAASRGENRKKGTKMEEIIAKLKELAAGDDAAEAAEAKALLAKMATKDDAEDGATEATTTETTEAAAATEAVAATSTGSDPVVTDLVATVQALSNRIATFERNAEGDERTRLLASRSDLAPELAAVLRKATTPIATVRDIVAATPRKVAAVTAIESAQATRGATQGTGNASAAASTISQKEQDAIRSKMGRSAPSGGVVNEGCVQVTSVMSAREARAAIQARRGGSAK